MMQIRGVWLLARKLNDECRKQEIIQHDHWAHSGHSYRACFPEQGFLERISKGNPRKRAEYADFLSLAKNKLKIIDSISEVKKCPDCGKEINVRLIRLNDDGLDFIGYLDFWEHILKKYTSVWQTVLIPIITFVLGVIFKTYFLS